MVNQLNSWLINGWSDRSVKRSVRTFDRPISVMVMTGHDRLWPWPLPSLIAMVLTSSSCNLGIENFDSRQVPNFYKCFFTIMSKMTFCTIKYIIYLYVIVYSNFIIWKIMWRTALCKICLPILMHHNGW